MRKSLATSRPIFFRLRFLIGYRENYNLLEDSKGVFRICISKKDRQHNGQKKMYKRTNNDLQNTTQKTTDRATGTPLKSVGQLSCSWRISSSCSTCGARNLTLVTDSVVSHKWGKDWIMITIDGTYPWSFVFNQSSL